MDTFTNSWMKLINMSLFSGLFWLTVLLFIISLFYLRKTKFNKSVLFFLLVSVFIFYLEPYYYFINSKGFNDRYFYQTILSMIAISAPAVLIVTEKIQLFSCKYSILTRYTKGKVALTLVLIVISAICLGFSLQQRSESEKNFIFEPIEVINTISKKAHTRPIFIYEGGTDLVRIPYYINAVQSNIINKGESPDLILKMCKALTFLDRNIFVYVRMSDTDFRAEYHGTKQDFKLKLLKEVVYVRHGRKAIFSLYQYEGR